MENIVINGQIETIGSDKDIIEVIEKNCGYEFSEYVNNRLNAPLVITDELREKILKESDFYSYEASLDSYNSAFCEVLEVAEEYYNYLNDTDIKGKANPLSRTKVIEVLENIMRIINNEI